jgi:hypothetical protein
MPRKKRKEKLGGGLSPTTELLLLAFLVIDALNKLYHQSGR